MTPFSVAQEFLQSIGNQLICINLNDVSETDFEFISRNCRSLKCLYLYLTCDLNLILPDNYVSRTRIALLVFSGFPSLLSALGIRIT
jgi:hypothetical protein